MTIRLWLSSTVLQLCLVGIIALVSLYLVARQARMRKPGRYALALQRLDASFVGLVRGPRGWVQLAARLFLVCWSLKSNSGLGRTDLAMTLLVAVMTNPTVLLIVAHHLQTLKYFVGIVRGG